jgi:hypothetical protein
MRRFVVCPVVEYEGHGSFRNRNRPPLLIPVLKSEDPRSVPAPFSGVSDSATCLVTLAFYFWTNMPRDEIFEARSIPMERSAGFLSVLLLQSPLPSTSRVDHIEGRTGSSSSQPKRVPRPFHQEPAKSSTPILCTRQSYVRFRHEHSVSR